MYSSYSNRAITPILKVFPIKKPVKIKPYGNNVFTCHAGNIIPHLLVETLSHKLGMQQL